MTDSPKFEHLACCWEFAAQFSGCVAHDLSNIFTGVTGFSELALQQLSPDHAAASYLKDGIRTGQRGIVFSRRLHQFHGAQIAERASCSLALVVDLARSRLEPLLPQGLQLDLRIQVDLPKIAVGPELLLSIISELLRNAVEACSPPGSVALSASVTDLSAEEARELIGRIGAGRYVELRVSDSGSGLPPSVRDSVGKTAMLTQRSGHWGLGLAIVLRGLYACGGGLAFEAGPGKGTVARAVLPVV